MGENVEQQPVVEKPPVKESVGTGDRNYETLEKKYEKNEKVKNILDYFSVYIDSKIPKNINKQEKDNIKLVILGEVFNKLEGRDIGKILTDAVFDYIKDFSGKIKKQNGQLEQKDKTEFENILSSLGLGDIESKINTILEKQKTKEMKKITDVFSVINQKNKKSEKEIYTKIEKQLEITSHILSKTTTGAGDIMSKIPVSAQLEIKDYLKKIATESPFIGFLISIFLGKEFLGDQNNVIGNDKEMVSINNLEKELKDKKFPLYGKVSDKFIDKIKDKKEGDKLEGIFKYFKNNDIDYSKEGFWTEFLSGKSTNEKIKALYDKIVETVGNEKGFNLSNVDKDTFEKNFLIKINFEAGELIKTPATETPATETPETTPATTPATIPTVAAGTAAVTGVTAKETPAATEKIPKPDFNKELISSLAAITTLPATIKYQGKDMVLDIKEGKNIVLGSNIYNISIMPSGVFEILGEQFEKIEFINGEFILNGKTETPIKKDQVVGLINTLQSGKDYIYNNGKSKEKVPYTITIKKSR